MTRLSEAAARRLLGGLLGEEPAQNAPRLRRTAQDARKAPTRPDAAPLIVTVAALPPSVNHLYRPIRRRTKSGRTVAAKAYSAEAEAWYDFAIPAIRSGAEGYAVPAGPLRLTIVAYALPRTNDVDNILKAAVDAIAHALGFDDRRVDYLAVARGVGKPQRTVYTLEAL